MNNRDRHSKRHNSNWKNSSQQNNRRDEGNSARQQNNFRRDNHHSKNAVTAEQIRENEEKIREFKNANRPLCCKCNQPITDMAQALADKTSGAPLHFDCALEQLSKTETLGQGDKLIYIGQGRFGIVNFENPHDMKHFKITKIIDWEERDKKASWRDEMADLYSQVK